MSAQLSSASSEASLHGSLHEDDVLLSPDGVPASVSNLTNSQMAEAQRVIDVLSNHDGSIEQARDMLISRSAHPSSTATVVTVPRNPPVMDDISPLVKEERLILEMENPQAVDPVEFVLTAPVSMGVEMDWEPDNVISSEEHPDDEEEHERVVRPTTPAPVAQPAPVPDRASPSTLDALLSHHLSTFYASITPGIDTLLKDTHEVRKTLVLVQSEIRAIRDEQSRLGSVLQDVNLRLDTMHGDNNATQRELIEMKGEISICTASFTKINSALLQMNAGGVPMGQLPNPQLYVTPMVSGPVPEEGPSGSTPIAYSDEKLQHLLEASALPQPKIEVAIKMLKHRTPRSLAELLPQFNTCVTVSHPLATALTDIARIERKEDLKHAVRLLEEIHQVSTPGAKISPVPESAKPPPGTITTAAVPLPQAKTRVVKCMNPFAKK